MDSRGRCDTLCLLLTCHRALGTYIISLGSLLLKRLLQLLHLTLLLHQTLVDQPERRRTNEKREALRASEPTSRTQLWTLTCFLSPARSSFCWRPPAGSGAARSSRCPSPPGPASASCSRAADGSDALWTNTWTEQRCSAAFHPSPAAH